MSKVKAVYRFLLTQLQRLDFLWSWWDRLPKWAKRSIGTAFALALSTVGASVTGVLVYVTGFVAEYWALAILMVLAGLGTGVLMRMPLMAIGGAIERMAEARGASRSSVPSGRLASRASGTRKDVATSLPHMPEDSRDILDRFRDGATPIRRNRDYGHYGSGYPRGFDWLRENYIVSKVTDLERSMELWEINEDVEDIVLAYWDENPIEDG